MTWRAMCAWPYMPDYMHDTAGIQNLTSLWIWAICLGATFIAWFISEGTLDVHYINTTRREIW